MLTANILQRTFHIKNNNFKGTAFTFERNEIQYLATVAHIFPYGEHGQPIDFSIMRKEEWHIVNSRIFKHENKNVDIAILQLPSDISPRHNINLSVEGLTLSQECYFNGFPYGSSVDDNGSKNAGYPFSYARKAIFSTIPFHEKGVQLFYLDATNNPGFSGAPCSFQNPKLDSPSICGIIKGYMPHHVEVQTPFGDYDFVTNSALVEVHSINHLLEIEV